MKVPERDRDAERPEGTVVVYRSNGRHAVKERSYWYDENGKRHTRDGDIVGYIVDGEFVESNGLPWSGGRSVPGMARI